MKLKMIVAMTKNLGIGINNTIPWYCKEDLKRFSLLTKGSGKNAIIMGKNTWNSLPKKPLLNRSNIIISNTLEDKENIVLSSIEESINFCLSKNYDEAWIIGGSMIYKEFIDHPLLTEIEMSLIIKDYDCDTFFPGIPLNFEINSLKKSDDESCYFCNFIRKY
jgi:dihydrofolate reductase